MSPEVLINIAAVVDPGATIQMNEKRIDAPLHTNPEQHLFPEDTRTPTENHMKPEDENRTMTRIYPKKEKKIPDSPPMYLIRRCLHLQQSLYAFFRAPTVPLLTKSVDLFGQGG